MSGSGNYYDEYKAKYAKEQEEAAIRARVHSEYAAAEKARKEAEQKAKDAAEAKMREDRSRTPGTPEYQMRINHEASLRQKSKAEAHKAKMKSITQRYKTHHYKVGEAGRLSDPGKFQGGDQYAREEHSVMTEAFKQQSRFDLYKAQDTARHGGVTSEDRVAQARSREDRLKEHDAIIRGRMQGRFSDDDIRSAIGESRIRQYAILDPEGSHAKSIAARPTGMVPKSGGGWVAHNPVFDVIEDISPRPESSAAPHPKIANKRF